ncbi:hypothetical protein PCANC_20468 [Puccinia coronata f. sp. avenae]|uniref:Uncharacterized protein n=1 Tax=Puccinia coronata f. sp. avenae TaxID=200324 RepID=A0A2N5U3J7_9BASI|nr:hypothetical protein PCANC_23188 [Puccinia coronata f. sp. avenae]PLW32317.1 hypothetical protein PCANC_20468 [Puccinia coronata f. sp. avenae]
MVAPLLGAGAPTHALTQLVFGGDLITLVHRRSPSQFHWSDQRSLSWSDERPFGPVVYGSLNSLQSNWWHPWPGFTLL